MRSPALTSAGFLPFAMAFTTMSRSVMIPLSRLSCPQTGKAPTFSSAIRRAASVRLSLIPKHSQPGCITSRAVVIIDLLPFLASFVGFLLRSEGCETRSKHPVTWVIVVPWVTVDLAAEPGRGYRHVHRRLHISRTHPENRRTETGMPTLTAETLRIAA